MSFNLYNINAYNDARLQYLKIGREFAKQYYSTYDNNFDNLGKYFGNNCCITYVDEKFSNFEDLKKRVNEQFIYKFYHQNLNCNCQPDGPNRIILTVDGNININYKNYNHKFI